MSCLKKWAILPNYKLGVEWTMRYSVRWFLSKIEQIYLNELFFFLVEVKKLRSYLSLYCVVYIDFRYPYKLLKDKTDNALLGNFVLMVFGLVVVCWIKWLLYYPMFDPFVFNLVKPNEVYNFTMSVNTIPCVALKFVMCPHNINFWTWQLKLKEVFDNLVMWYFQEASNCGIREYCSETCQLSPF